MLTVWESELAHVGQTTVLRALPHHEAQAIGPFVFLDHFGPAPAKPGTLPAHPHAGIEVMTYLIEGSNEHRDSAGHTGRVKSGGAQYMRAGSGVLHSERILDDAPVVHGLQFWARMPVAMQDDPPSYRGIASEDVPSWSQDGVDYRLLAGTSAGKVGPLELCLPAFMLHMIMSAGSSVHIDLPEPAHEYGVYGVETPDAGVMLEGNTPLTRGGFAKLASGQTRIAIGHDAAADAPAQLFILGGAPAPRPLVFGGPFVYDSQANLRLANQRYGAGQMGTLDGVPF
jgi:quercetin 2,3-dioxygenase